MCPGNYLNTVAFVLISVQSPSSLSSQDDVKQILSKWDKIGAGPSAGTFDAFSDEELIPALVAALNRTPAYETDEVRVFAYRELVARNAVRTKVGLAEFIRCLSDPAAAGICGETLLRAPQEAQAQVVEAIRLYLQTADRPDAAPPYLRSGPEQVLDEIARKGQDGQAYVDVLQSILQDQDRHPEVRKRAAAALAVIEPFPEVLKRFERVDDLAGIEAVVAGIGARLMALQRGVNRKTLDDVYDENRAEIDAARALFRRALRSPRIETRRYALEVIGVVYGSEIVVIRSPEDYELTPELRPILENMAQNDLDATLRERSARMLQPETVHLMVENVLRARDSQRQNAESESNQVDERKP